MIVCYAYGKTKVIFSISGKHEKYVTHFYTNCSPFSNSHPCSDKHSCILENSTILDPFDIGKYLKFCYGNLEAKKGPTCSTKIKQQKQRTYQMILTGGCSRQIPEKPNKCSTK